MHLYGNAWVIGGVTLLVSVSALWFYQARKLQFQEQIGDISKEKALEVQSSARKVREAVNKAQGSPSRLEDISPNFIFEILAAAPTSTPGFFLFIVQKKNHGEHTLALRGKLEGNLKRGVFYSVIVTKGRYHALKEVESTADDANKVISLEMPKEA